MVDLIGVAREWIANDPDPETRAEIQQLIEEQAHGALADRFAGALTFGTAGIRGEVGGGSARMNLAVVIRTTAGLAEYLSSSSGSGPIIVGFDARPDSRRFAEAAGGVLAAADLPVLYFADYVPTPLVAFAAKHLRARAAIVITASHNPPKDNGYKVYGPNAAQIVPPVDEHIQAAIERAPGASAVPRVERAFTESSSLVRPIDLAIVDDYWTEVSDVRSRDRGSELSIVYTPLHGVGNELLARVMDAAGHGHLRTVPSQAHPDGAFPTVDFPNPEEPGALDLAYAEAESRRTDLILANDPDADRLAVSVPTGSGWQQLTGNEVGALLATYLLENAGRTPRPIVASSIVSSPILDSIAASHDALRATTLTGFKWIMHAVLSLEQAGEGRFLFGYEEALGYSVGRVVRDKDGISAAVIFSDLVADLADRGLSIPDRLAEIWSQHGLWVSTQESIKREGADGQRDIREAIARIAKRPPDDLAGESITEVVDYRSGQEERPPWLGAQDLVELRSASGRALIRPSGTEPKVKIYVDLKSELSGDPVSERRALEEKAGVAGRSIASSLGL